MVPTLICDEKILVESSLILEFLEDKFPNRRSSKRRHSAGVGYSDGRSKAESVGLHKQTSGNKTLALTGK